jgi:hypothetical protein
MRLAHASVESLGKEEQLLCEIPFFAKLTTQKEGWMKKKVQIFPIFSLFGVISTHI